MLPCQDTPSVKATYSATVTSPLRVLTSGRQISSKSNSDGTKTYSSVQPVPIPSYLITLAAGGHPLSLYFSNNRYRRRANWSTKHPLHRTFFPLRLPIRIPSRHRILHLHSRETSNPLRMVNLRRPRPPQIISLRRYGESELDDRDPNFDCRGQK